MEAEHERACAEGRRRAERIVALALQRSEQLDAESAARRLVTEADQPAVARVQEATRQVEQLRTAPPAHRATALGALEAGRRIPAARSRSERKQRAR